jgi:hypothetical protein
MEERLMCEVLSLGELRLLKTALENKATRLRTELHELSGGDAMSWQSRFDVGQRELMVITTRIGALNRRICAVVEGESSARPQEGGCNV